MCFPVRLCFRAKVSLQKLPSSFSVVESTRGNMKALFHLIWVYLLLILFFIFTSTSLDLAFCQIMDGSTIDSVFSAFTSASIFNQQDVGIIDVEDQSQSKKKLQNLNILLHAQVDPSSGFIVGSVLTTSGMKQASESMHGMKNHVRRNCLDVISNSYICCTKNTNWKYY